MSIFKCKMCGGTLEIQERQTTAVCEYCGTKQTLPRLSDDRRANLYDRANHFRRNNDFDKASNIYEQILAEDTADAETYWSLVLCRYGIEYVEDPSTHKRVPTVNRAQFTAIFDDSNYKSALQYADSYQKLIYEAEANAINEIQKGILAVSQHEDPFDVFICYKETDDAGRRTPDSVLANDLYHQLTQEGFKVFYSRITLEDKLGCEYEPYIFAALNSAKVMVVLGTKPAYFNAVWVKNEWSRYLLIVKESGGKKVLIPAYKDMDPYNLPEEFSHLQAQDMSKLGFMQDLLRGIKKLAMSDESKTILQETVVPIGNANITALLQRGNMALEDGEWSKADEFFDRVLDMNAQCAEAYLGKLMTELNCKDYEELKNCKELYDHKSNCQKALRFGDENLKAELSDCISCIRDQNESERKENIYSEAVMAMEKAQSQKDYENIIEQFQLIHGLKDSDERITYCQREIEKIEDTQKKERLERELKVEEKRIATERRKKKAKKIATIVIPTVCAVILLILVFINVICPYINYNKVQKCIKNGEYKTALDVALNLTGYKDIDERIPEIKYLYANNLLIIENYADAYNYFDEISTYKDSKEKITESGYFYAHKLICDNNLKDAIFVLEKIGEYRDSLSLLNDCYYNYAKELNNQGEYAQCIHYYCKISNYNKNEDFYLDSKYNLALNQVKEKDYVNAVRLLDEIEGYKDSPQKKQDAMYEYVEANYINSDMITYDYLTKLKTAEYLDSVDLFKTLYAWKLTVVAKNNLEDNAVTSMTQLNKFDTWYFHYEVSGGEPGAATTIKSVLIFPDGDTHTMRTDWKASNGTTAWVSGFYENPAYGSGGTFSVKFYDEDDNLIGQDSVSIVS